MHTSSEARGQSAMSSVARGLSSIMWVVFIKNLEIFQLVWSHLQN